MRIVLYFRSNASKGVLRTAHGRDKNVRAFVFGVKLIDWTATAIHTGAIITGFYLRATET